MVLEHGRSFGVRDSFGFSSRKNTESYSEIESNRKKEVENEYSEFYQISGHLAFISILSASILLIGSNNTLAYLSIYIGSCIFLIMGVSTYMEIQNINARYGKKMKSVRKVTFDNEFYEREYRGKDIKESAKNYPSIGLNTVITTIEDIYVPKNDDSLVVKLDIPIRDNNDTWKFDYPFSWNTEMKDEEDNFAVLADRHGYTKDNFDEMIGCPVAVKIKNGKWKSMFYTSPKDLIKDRLEKGEITKDDIDAEQIVDKFGIEIPYEIAVGEEIIMENNPLKDKKDWR